MDNNDVFKFSVKLKFEIAHRNVSVYTLVGLYTEESLEKDYFTQERIEELKNEVIQKIKESPNPFEIECIDLDGNYNITEDMLFNPSK